MLKFRHLNHAYWPAHIDVYSFDFVSGVSEEESCKYLALVEPENHSGLLAQAALAATGALEEF